MCGRYAITIDPARLAAEVGGIDETLLPGDQERWRPRYNVAPTSEILIVTAAEDPDDARPRVRTARWGLVPPWAKEFGAGPVLFNARAETVTDKPSFRADVRRHRCLVPMDGWYEWRPGAPDAATGRPVKNPVYMALRGGRRLAMAGIWSTYRDGRRSATVLTVDAVGALAAVHDRMPRILAPADWSRWLDPGAGPAPDLLAPLPTSLAEEIEIRPVSRLVNSVRNDGPQLLDPVPVPPVSHTSPESDVRGQAEGGQLPLL